MRLIPPVLLVLVSLLVSPAAAQDYVEAFNAYQRGEYARALHDFRTLAKRGDVLAQYRLGLMYVNGDGVEKDYAESVKWFSRAAIQGYAPAQTSLGVRFEKGQGVRRNYAEAVRWYRHGAESGEPMAQYRLGRMYTLGHGVRRHYTEAVAWFTVAASHGIADAEKARAAVAAHLSKQQLANAARKSRERN